jgi:hypothetical protein
MFYMQVEFRSNDNDLLHSAIVTPQELAEHFRDYRGKEHRITGIMTAEEVKDLSLIDRGLAHLAEAA